MIGRGKKFFGHGRSMRYVMLVTMWALIFLFVALFVSISVLGRLFPSLNDIALRTLHSQAVSNTSPLSVELTAVARTARKQADALEGELRAYLNQEQLSIDELMGDKKRIDALLTPGYESAASLLENISATGAFVMLNTSYTDSEHRAMIYLRDPTPGTGGSPDMDLTLQRGPLRLTAQRNPSLEVSWAYEQTLSDATDLSFYNNPQQAAFDYPKADRRDWGYWSRPFQFSGRELSVVTFTTPLLDSENRPIGVFGVEMTVRYLSQMIPASSLPFDGGFLMLGRLEDGRIFPSSSFSSQPEGALLLRDHQDGLPLTPLSQSADYQVYRAGDEIYVAYHPLTLHGQNTPYVGEDYYLFAVAPASEVGKNAGDVITGMAYSILIAMALAILASWFSSRYLSGRIEKLALEVGSVDPGKPVSLSKTDIQEVDVLAEVIEQMSRSISQYAARMSNIVDLVGIQLGAFEVDLQRRTVFLTESLFQLLRLPHEQDDTHTLDEVEFIQLLKGLAYPRLSDDPFEQNLDLIDSKTREERNFRIRMIRLEMNIYGAIIDVTEEVRQMKWLEFERDYDPLTRLLNRNAYPAKMSALIHKEPGKMGALLFGDLDNLKFINDTFGHDMGDRYIQMAASALMRFDPLGGVVARISGDEFAVYLHGYSSRDEIRRLIDKTVEEIRATEMTLPDGTQQKVRISIGLSFYPDDAQDIETLIKYADFAMYEIKHSVKGLTGEFDPESYQKNSFILRKPNHLDRLIEDKRMRFAFQPIIDVRTGAPHAYEALMRPMIREIHSPLEVLALAKSQSKLYQIEVLTLECAVDWLTKNRAELGDRLLFVNLIANQLLNDGDYRRIRSLMPDCTHFVMEITEGEQSTEEITAKKLKSMRDMGCKIALDDYGTGYNSETSLLSIGPDYIKVDMSIVHKIDKDPNRRRLLSKVVDYAGVNGIHVIAEGVENESELRTVISLGARFIQGYYLGQPKYELDEHDRTTCAQAAAFYREFFPPVEG